MAMTKQLKILALVPARGGSKRLPGKNKRPLGGKPLVIWSIEVIAGLPEICDILVSTDDLEIAEIAKNAGALVPWLRPPMLSTDTSSSIDVALHALDWYESQYGTVDGLLLLQPTSPFRRRASVHEAISRFSENPSLPVIGISPTHAHPLWTLKIQGEHCVPYFQENGLNSRSQDLIPAYVVNGSIYLCSPLQLRETGSFIVGKNIPLIMKSYKESIDIDTETDFEVAEWMVNWEEKTDR